MQLRSIQQVRCRPRDVRKELIVQTPRAQHAYCHRCYHRDKNIFWVDTRSYRSPHCQDIWRVRILLVAVIIGQVKFEYFHRLNAGRHPRQDEPPPRAVDSKQEDVQLQQEQREAWREEDSFRDKAVVYGPFVEEDAG
jgi:hypothetical protein